MKSTHTLPLTALALGIMMLFGTSTARAQTFYVWQDPWGPTYHDLTFTSVSNIQDVNWTQYYLYSGQVTIKVGFTFQGRTASGQIYTVSVLGPGGNIIGTRVGAAERDMMEHVVKAFRDNPQYYSALRLYHVEKYPYTSYTMTPSSKMKIEVTNPHAATDTDLNGGLIELVVNGGGDFYAEAKIQRAGNCDVNGNGMIDMNERSTFKRSRISALRNTKSFILNRQTTFSQVSPVSAALAVEFVRIAVDGVPFLDVSGALKLEDNDPYHLSGNDSCLKSTYLLTNAVVING